MKRENSGDQGHSSGQWLFADKVMPDPMKNVSCATYRGSRVESVALPTGEIVRLRGERDQPRQGVKKSELAEFFEWYPEAGDWEGERFRKELFDWLWCERLQFSQDEIFAWTDHNAPHHRLTTNMPRMAEWVLEQREQRARAEYVRGNAQLVLREAAKRRAALDAADAGFRRTKNELELVDQTILSVLKEYHPQSVRHTFYVLLGLLPGLITKDDYDVVDQECIKLRRAGVLPYAWISDTSRGGFHVATYADGGDLIARHAEFYRVDLWRRAKVHVEVWVESRSIAGVLLPLCRELCVSLYPTAGFSSLTQTWQAVERMKSVARGRPIRIVYVGDYDPAGTEIDRDAIKQLREHLEPHAEALGMTEEESRIQKVRVALNEEQIAQYGLPTKPRSTGDKRRLDITRTVECEALPVEVLCELVRTKVESFLPQGELEVMRTIEAEERKGLRILADLTSEHGTNEIANLCLDSLRKRE